MRTRYSSLLLLLLAACTESEPGEVELTPAERQRAEAVLRRQLTQPDPVAVAVGLKHNVGADTVLAIVRAYAQDHDLPLRVRLAGAEPALLRGGEPAPSPTARATVQALARRYGCAPALVGALIYDYKVASIPAR